MQQLTTKGVLFFLALHLALTHGVVRLINVQPTSSTSLGPVSNVMRDGIVLWSELANARGGIVVNGTKELIELIVVDVGASNSSQIAANIKKTFQAIKNGTYGEVHAVLGPYTTGLSETFSVEAEKAKITACLPAAAAPQFYECDNTLPAPCTRPFGRRFEYSVGTQPSAAATFPQALSLAMVKGARTVGIFRETGSNEQYFAALHKGAVAAAIDNKMTVLVDMTIPVISKIDETAKESIRNVIAKMNEFKPDVVVGGVLQAGCFAFVQVAKELNFTAKAIMLSVCAATPEVYKETLGMDGRFMWGPVPWDRRLTGRTFNEDGSSSLHYFPATETKPSPQVFYETYLERFGQTPSYHAAGGFSCGLSMQYAFETAATLSSEDLRTNINRISQISFYGKIQFSLFGQIVENGLGATIQFDKDNAETIILPVAASAKEVIYPMPEWVERQEVIAWYSQSAELGIVSVAGIGFAVCLVLMVLFLAWRDRPQIIASSLVFVELIILGIAMMYASLFVWVLETTTAMCNLRYWLVGIGFVLMFSALLTKTWRIWRIFHEKSLKIIKMTNAYLLRIVAVALGIEIVVLAIWSGAFTPVAASVVVDENRPLYNYRACMHPVELPFAIIFSIFKGSLIVAGVVLGFWSRKLRSEYNESKFILLSMYNITFSAIILLILYAIKLEDRQLDFILRSVAILWGITATLCIMFIPKIFYVVQGTKNPTKRTSGSWNSSGSRSSGAETYESVQQQLDHLAKREQFLREQLVELKAAKKHSKAPNSFKTNSANMDVTTTASNNSV